MTFDEIAKELNVSKTTVSRALSGKGRIGEETKNRIIEYARQNGISVEKGTKNRNATKNIGVVLPADVYSSGAPYFQECILGVCETATFFDYDVVIATETTNNVSEIYSLVEKKKVDGIILTRNLEDNRGLKYLTDIDFPVGLTGITSYDSVIQVDTDNKAAAESLTSLLISKGYRKFALILDDMEYMVNKSRYGGFCEALKKNNIALESQEVISGPLRVDLFDNLFERLFAKKVECIICGDDVICTRTMSSLQALGYRIPKDISVASLYNSPNLDCFTPSVTSVNVSARQVGNVICRQMIQYLEGKEFQKRTMIDYEILVRKSASGLDRE